MLQLIIDQTSRESDTKVPLLNAPSWPRDTVTPGAWPGHARDVVAGIDTHFGRPMSFRCLRDPAWTS